MDWHPLIARPVTPAPELDDFGVCSECSHLLNGKGDCPSCGLNFFSHPLTPLVRKPYDRQP